MPADEESVLWAVLSLALVTACGTGDAAPGTDEDSRAAAPLQTAGDGTGSTEVDLQYSPELQVDLANMARTPSGLYIRDITEGTGDLAVTEGSVVRVHYTGWFPNGVEFDSSRDDDEPLEFSMGQGEVLAGWEEALMGMRAGGRRLIVLPPALAFGAGGLPGLVPENATLVFDLELVEIVQ